MKKSLGTKPAPTREKIAAAKMRKKLLFNIARIFAVGTVFTILLGSITLFALIAWYSRDLPNPNTLVERAIPQSTKIYDRTGTHLLYEIHNGEKRTLLKAEDIPQAAKDAAIQLEDKSFYEHGGVSVSGLMRIVATPILCRINAARFCRAGGSTITQQLVKNAILTNETSVYIRKLKEILLTLEIERRFSKDQILQMYFNEIPFGSTNYGLESAAESYFGKPAKELSIAESATLVSITRSPTAYLNDTKKLQSRRDYALSLMKEAGKITAAEYEQAKATEVKILPRLANIKAPHFVTYVREKLEQEFGVREVEQGGLKVITSLDLDKQLIAEEEVKNGVEKTGTKYKFSNAALVAIDPKTGQVLAMVGSKDYFASDIDGMFNVATSPSRQPGSSFKPIVYTAAWAKGYTPETILWDVATDFPSVDKPYSPKNYDLIERGPISLRSSLQGSLNIPAVKLLYLVGLERTLELAKDFGYTTLPTAKNVGLSLVLGGGSVPLLEHVNAYATLANEGTRNPISTILSVEKPSGEKIFEWTPQPFRVVDVNIARTTSDVLSDNNARAYVFGAVNSLILGDRPVAAKTGTTNDYVDAWTLGYTPSLAAGVWAGNNDPSQKMNKAGGSLAAAPIWNAFMKRALKGTPVETFTKPEPLPANKPVLAGYKVDVPLNPDGTPGDQPKLILEDGTVITNYGPCTTGNSGFNCEMHEILHYLDKDDPLGDPPQNPAADGMYQPFEDALTKWLTDHKVTQSMPVATTEPGPSNGLGPTVTILSPFPNEMIANRSVSWNATIIGNTSPATHTEFWMNGTKLGETSGSGSWSGVLPNKISPGIQTLRIISRDQAGNSGEASAQINLTAPINPVLISVTKPASGSIIKTKNFPVTFNITTSNKLQAIDMFFNKVGEPEMFYGTTPNPGLATNVTWNTAPAPGTYVIQMRGREDGNVYHYATPVTLIIE